MREGGVFVSGDQETDLVVFGDRLLGRVVHHLDRLGFDYLDRVVGRLDRLGSERTIVNAVLCIVSSAAWISLNLFSLELCTLVMPCDTLSSEPG